MLIYDSDGKCRILTARKNKISLIAEQILAFASSPNMVMEVKNLSPNVKQITWRCFTLLNILIWIVRSILSINSKQFHLKSYSNSLYIFDTACHFLYKIRHFLYFPGILLLFCKLSVKLLWGFQTVFHIW